jgi:DNA-binding CsgD family transcriptional regulator
MRRLSRGPQVRANALFESLLDAEHGVVHVVLDPLPAGVALLDHELRIQFANKALRAIGSEAALNLRGQSLACSWLPCAPRLGNLARAVLAGAAGGTIAVPHPDDGRLITTMVRSVRGRDAFTGPHLRHTAAILFMLDPGRTSRLPPEWIMDTYQLTMAEAQVALQASTGRSVSEIGVQLNVSPNTVKTHLRSIFAKTHVRGRRELVGLIAALGSVRCLP